MTGATAVSSGAVTIPRRRGSSLTGQRRWALWGSYAALAVFVAMFLTPPFYMVMTSLKTSAEISAERGNPWLAHHPTLQNFSELIANSNFQHFFLNSVIVTICVVVISMAISIFAAFSLARIGFLGSQFLATGVFLTYLIPGPLLFIPLFQIVGALGLINNVWCLVLIYPTLAVPFCTWIMIGYFETTPLELEEAALIDGATRWQVFRHVALPIARPGIAVAFILAVIFSWNNFVFGIVLAGRETRTLPVAVYNMISFDQLSWGPLAAAALLVTLPVLLLTVFAQRQIVAGLTAGSVKGG